MFNSLFWLNLIEIWGGARGLFNTIVMVDNFFFSFFGGAGGGASFFCSCEFVDDLTFSFFKFLFGEEALFIEGFEFFHLGPEKFFSVGGSLFLFGFLSFSCAFVGSCDGGSSFFHSFSFHC